MVTGFSAPSSAVEKGHFPRALGCAEYSRLIRRSKRREAWMVLEYVAEWVPVGVRDFQENL